MQSLNTNIINIEVSTPAPPPSTAQPPTNGASPSIVAHYISICIHLYILCACIYILYVYNNCPAPPRTDPLSTNAASLSSRQLHIHMYTSIYIHL